MAPASRSQYLRGYFALDVFTCVPFDIVFNALAASASVDLDAQFFRLLRMLRLLKLVRMVRGMRIIARWQDHVGLSFAFLALLKFAVMTVVLAHWLCLLYTSPSPRDS